MYDAMLERELQAAGPTGPLIDAIVRLTVEIRQPATPEPLPLSRIDRHEPSRIAYRALMPQGGLVPLGAPARFTGRRRWRSVAAHGITDRVEVQHSAGAVDGELEPAERFHPG